MKPRICPNVVLEDGVPFHTDANLKTVGLDPDRYEVTREHEEDGTPADVQCLACGMEITIP